MAMDIDFENIDPFIRSLVKEVNELGFSTAASCSGLQYDHLKKNYLFSPYLVIFDDCYGGVRKLLLAFISGSWSQRYDQNERTIFLSLDVELTDSEKENAWKQLRKNLRNAAMHL